MAALIIPDLHQTLFDASDIKAYLESRGIWFDQWQANAEFDKDASPETVLAAYDNTLKPFMEKGGYTVADVIVVYPTMPNLKELRDKFLREHTHTEDEVRFFVEGQGYFWFHLEGSEQPVFCVKCEAGDLLSVPAGIKHWFDLGEKPFVKAIRIFIDQAGWVPQYTNSGMDARYQLTTAY